MRITNMYSLSKPFLVNIELKSNRNDQNNDISVFHHVIKIPKGRVIKTKLNMDIIFTV